MSKTKQNLHQILSRLIAFRTTPGSYSAINDCYEYISQELSWYPFVVRSHTHNHVRSMTWSTNPGLHSHLTLSAHIDVVQAEPGMFKLVTRGDNWHGRGTIDMKFAVASYIVSLRDIYHHTGALPPLTIMITSDEEVGGFDGTNHLLNQVGYTTNFAFVPDGGLNWHVVQSAKGALHIQVKAQGISSHASQPWLGESAIDNLLNNLSQMRQSYQLPDASTSKTTINIGTIAGGAQTNQISHQASASLDIRHPSTVSSNIIILSLQNIFGTNNIQVLVTADSFSSDPTHPLIKSWISRSASHTNTKNILISEHGSSDGRYFSSLNIPTLITQPHGGALHADNEHIKISSLIDFTETLTKWLSSPDMKIHNNNVQ